MERYRAPLVVFVDEVDAVRSLSFQTDEFLAAMRECFNRRAVDREFERLTFCMLGVAKPDDLIQDGRSTPFNIGQHIELTDFTAKEAQGLVAGLKRDSQLGECLLSRVFYWTSGHPYLTQRLCRSISEDPSIETDEGVDALCEQLFLSARAQEEDDNINFVRRWLVSFDENNQAVLSAYRSVLIGKSASCPESVVQVLRLSGIVRMMNDRFETRNRIYAKVFSKDWIQTILAP